MPRLAAALRSVAFAALALAAFVGCASSEDAASGGTDDDIVGGKPDARWPAAGFLSHGTDVTAAGKAAVSCGATLVAPNVVVTAAHCVQRAPNDVWVFGAGELGTRAPVKVAAVRIHPQFHEAPKSMVDVRYFLKNFDLATLVLETPIRDVAPATLPAAATPVGCSYRAVGYRADATSRARRRSTGACVQFRLDLAGDPIFEVHPTGSSALCNGDGDEGSPMLETPSDTAPPVLHGIYVGSVSQGLTDCRRGTQFLDGYEAMYGFRDFVNEGIAEGKKRL
jgi:hypothetical protein